MAMRYQMFAEEKWDRRFLELAKHVAGWSKDPSTQVGACIVDSDRRILSVGYNGFARGVNDSPERLNTRETKYKFVVHAEVNACIAAGFHARGATLYVWPTFALPPVCQECAKVVVQSGILAVVGYTPDPSRDFARWADSIAVASAMFAEAGVQVRSWVP